MGRMHDKYLIADDTAYILGGRNTFNYFLGDYGGQKNYDRDVLVYQTESDPGSLDEVERYYREITSLDYCSRFHDQEKIGEFFSVRRASAKLRERFAQMKKEQPGFLMDPMTMRHIRFRQSKSICCPTRFTGMRRSRCCFTRFCGCWKKIPGIP